MTVLGRVRLGVGEAAHEHDAEVIRKAPGGGVLVQIEDGPRRWVPDHWLIDEVEVE